MEGCTALLRASGQLALASILGGLVFLMVCVPRRARDPAQGWYPEASLVGLNLWLLASASALFVLRAAALGDGQIPDLEQLRIYAAATHVGRIASLQLVLGLLLLVPLTVLRRPRAAPLRRVALGGAVLIAALITLMGPLAGHAAADEDRHWPLLLHLLHVLAVSLWLGALPWWLALVWQAQAGAGWPRTALRHSLQQFSQLATVCMLLLVPSGIGVAWRYLDTQGDLLGTAYGLLVCAKLLLLAAVLLLASRIRAQWLPTLLNGSAPSRSTWALRVVGAECVLAMLIVLLAAVLAQTTPAVHAQALWPLPRRLSLAASWPLPDTPATVLAALALSGFALLALRLLRGRGLARGLALLLAAAGLGTALWKLSVPAYPDSYRRSTAPYLTVSIDEGMRHFRQQCTACHGPGGLGDGPLAAQLPRRPANLSEPHTALHTAGDMFWWLTHGIPESGMPAFGSQLDVQARWDTINFLRAFSQGFQSRVLDTEVLARSPWLGAPNFYFEDAQGQQHELKDFREQRNVLLVFVQPADRARDRAETLARWTPQLQQARTAVLMVSAPVPASPGLQLVADNSGAIHRAYELLSRTFANRGSGRQLGLARQHMEFLLDRFGYIRARWIPGESKGSWEQLQALLTQLQALNAEPRLLPPPDDHVH